MIGVLRHRDPELAPDSLKACCCVRVCRMGLDLVAGSIVSNLADFFVALDGGVVDGSHAPDCKELYIARSSALVVLRGTMTPALANAWRRSETVFIPVARTDDLGQRIRLKKIAFWEMEMMSPSMIKRPLFGLNGGLKVALRAELVCYAAL